jgi:hypothetical protein
VRLDLLLLLVTVMFLLLLPLSWLVCHCYHRYQHCHWHSACGWEKHPPQLQSPALLMSLLLLELWVAACPGWTERL